MFPSGLNSLSSAGNKDVLKNSGWLTNSSFSVSCKDNDNVVSSCCDLNDIIILGKDDHPSNLSDKRKSFHAKHSKHSRHRHWDATYGDSKKQKRIESGASHQHEGRRDINSLLMITDANYRKLVFIEDLPVHLTSKHDCTMYYARIDCEPDASILTWHGTFKGHVAKYRPACRVSSGFQSFYTLLHHVADSDYIVQDTLSGEDMKKIEKLRSKSIRKTRYFYARNQQRIASIGNDHDVDVCFDFDLTTLPLAGVKSVQMKSVVKECHNRRKENLQQSIKKLNALLLNSTDVSSCIQDWLQLVNLQEEMYKIFGGFAMHNELVSDSKSAGCNTNAKCGDHETIILEKQLSILDRALLTHPRNVQLTLKRLELLQCAILRFYFTTTSSLDLPSILKDKSLNADFDKLLCLHANSVPLWQAYIDFYVSGAVTRGSYAAYSTQKVKEAYEKACGTLRQVLSGRLLSHLVLPGTEEGLLNIVTEYCNYLANSGYTELSLATWQALVEYNCFMPSSYYSIIDNTDWKLVATAEQLIREQFTAYWRSGAARIGEILQSSNLSQTDFTVGGWKWWDKNRDAKIAENFTDVVIRASENAENDLIDNILASSNVENTLINNSHYKLEVLRDSYYWLPLKENTDDSTIDDPDRIILYEDISKMIVWFSNVEIKKRLLLRFVHFLQPDLILITDYLYILDATLYATAVDNLAFSNNWFENTFLLNQHSSKGTTNILDTDACFLHLINQISQSTTQSWNQEYRFVFLENLLQSILSLSTHLFYNLDFTSYISQLLLTLKIRQLLCKPSNNFKFLTKSLKSAAQNIISLPNNMNNLNLYCIYGSAQCHVDKVWKSCDRNRINLTGRMIFNQALLMSQQAFVFPDVANSEISLQKCHQHTVLLQHYCMLEMTDINSESSNDLLTLLCSWFLTAGNLQQLTLDSCLILRAKSALKRQIATLKDLAFDSENGITLQSYRLVELYFISCYFDVVLKLLSGNIVSGHSAYQEHNIEHSKIISNKAKLLYISTLQHHFVSLVFHALHTFSLSTGNPMPRELWVSLNQSCIMIGLDDKQEINLQLVLYNLCLSSHGHQNFGLPGVSQFVTLKQTLLQSDLLYAKFLVLAYEINSFFNKTNKGSLNVIRRNLEQTILVQNSGDYAASNRKFRLMIWLLYLKFECFVLLSDEKVENVERFWDSKASELVRGVFFRAIAEFPWYKCLYLEVMQHFAHDSIKFGDLMTEKFIQQRIAGGPDEVQIILEQAKTSRHCDSRTVNLN